MKFSVTLDGTEAEIVIRAENNSERRLLNALDGLYDLKVDCHRKFSSSDGIEFVQITGTQSHVPRPAEKATGAVEEIGRV